MLSLLVQKTLVKENNKNNSSIDLTINKSKDIYKSTNIYNLSVEDI
jgi:hypothetical protein